MRRFLRRSRGDRCLVIVAAAVAAVVQGLLRLVPYRHAVAALGGTGAVLLATRPLRGVSPDRLIWAVDAVSRACGMTCLPQALTAQALLAAHGWNCDVRFGVRRPHEGVLQAHAWLERDGRTLVGGAPLPLYEPLVNRHA